MLAAVVVTALAALAWLYLLAGHGGFWRTDQRLPAPGPASPGTGPPGSWPSVTVVIPARDEAEVLPTSLPSLLGQDYPGPLRLVLVDDQSSDGTAEVAAGLARQADQAGRLTVLAGQPLPAGWAGKVWAMHQGLERAAGADYVLFTDADIAYRPGAVRALACAAEGSRRDLVSQMALLRADSGWERLLIPAFVYFFAQLYPFRRVNRPGGRTAAAAGGCMLVRRAALAAAGGLEPISSARIDDVALGTMLKRRPGAAPTWLGFTCEVISTRSYRRLAEIWDMVARSAYTQLRYSPVALAGTVLGMIWLYLVPVAATAAGLVLAGLGPAAAGISRAQAAGLAGAGLAAWAIMAASYLPVLRLYRLSPARALTLPAIGVLYTAMTVSSARRHYAGRGGEWKGRTIERNRVAR